MGLLKSWVASANVSGAEFPLNNLPYGVFSQNGGEMRCGVAIGDKILDVTTAEKNRVLCPASSSVFGVPSWNGFMGLGPKAWAKFRADLTRSLSQNAGKKPLLEPFLVDQKDVDLHLPIAVAEFTDFYAGEQHARNIGAILRGTPDVPENWHHIPIGYNGRASSVVVSGTDVRRPLGQTKNAGAADPVFGPTDRLDFELELGAIVGVATKLGQPVSVTKADTMIFGYVLLNDWSARDIQAWEYKPLGPFQSKAFATTIGPWIVTAAALEPFRTKSATGAVDLLDYLKQPAPGLYDISLSVFMRSQLETNATEISRTNYSRMYYTAAQQLCHHTISGCKMNVGDLLGSGTISGPTFKEFGSLMELSWGGSKPVTLDSGEKRYFIQDGDTITLRGQARGPDFTIGFGRCEGRVTPALVTPAWAKPR